MYQCQRAKKDFAMLQPTTPSFRPLWQSHIEEVSACWENSLSSLAVSLRVGLLVAEPIRQSDESDDAS